MHSVNTRTQQEANELMTRITNQQFTEINANTLETEKGTPNRLNNEWNQTYKRIKTSFFVLIMKQTKQLKPHVLVLKKKSKCP